jgi:hypothetical protein
VGSNYLLNARGEISGAASDTDREVLVTDLEQSRVVRNVWQCYHDRWPDRYGPTVQA